MIKHPACFHYVVLTSHIKNTTSPLPWHSSCYLLSPMNDMKDIIVKCCVCGRVLINTSWRQMDEDPGDDVLVSHGFCPVCFENAMASLDREEKVTLDAVV